MKLIWSLLFIMKSNVESKIWAAQKCEKLIGAHIFVLIYKSLCCAFLFRRITVLWHQTFLKRICFFRWLSTGALEIVFQPNRERVSYSFTVLFSITFHTIAYKSLYPVYVMQFIPTLHFKVIASFKKRMCSRYFLYCDVLNYIFIYLYLKSSFRI